MRHEGLPKLLLVVVAAGCAGGGHGAGPAFAVRDSAGVEIADVAHPGWTEGAGWTVGAEPVLTIGALEGDDAYQLFRVSRAIRLDDGAIVVANGGTSELRWYDGDGRFVRTAGGEGEGPGEFGRLWSVALANGELVAYDYRVARMTRFDTAGALLGTVQLAREPGLPLDVWPAGDGWIGMLPGIAFDVTADASYRRRNTTWVRYASDGTLVDTIVALPGMEMVVSGAPVAGGFAMTMSSPIIAHGSQQTVVGDRLVAASTDRFEIGVYGRTGLARLIRDPSRDLPVTDSEWDAAVAEAMADAESPEARRSVQELASLKPAPATRPAFDRFVADRLGLVWIAPYRPAAGRPTPWLVVDPDGGILGTVDLPEGFRPTDIGPDWVLGVVRDELDVEQVRMYPLHRTSD